MSFLKVVSTINMASLRITLGLTLIAALGTTAQQCTKAAKTPGLHAFEITVGSDTREFYVTVPEGLSPTLNYPVMMLFHGCGSSPEKYEFESSMNVRASEAKFYNIYPRGTTTNSKLGWNAGFSTCETAARYNDVEFTRRIHSWALENLCVSNDKFFAAGFSNGGSMVQNLTCEMPAYFTAFAYAGSTMPPVAYPTSESCGNGGLSLDQIKPILNVCGATDGCNNGIASWFREYGTFMECADQPRENRVSSTTTCYEHAQCGVQKNLPLQYCSVSNLGHCWSRGGGCCDKQCLNQSPENVDASVHIINFFSDIARNVNPNSAI
eukprot:m.79040 g.79040  ORF g.79040 m.79040 type:complete len:323 (+) comp25172_c1_seq1:72-1040(+)